jgi:hypothetical protein
MCLSDNTAQVLEEEWLCLIPTDSSKLWMVPFSPIPPWVANKQVVVFDIFVISTNQF